MPGIGSQVDVGSWRTLAAKKPSPAQHSIRVSAVQIREPRQREQ
jgi:hypothetical protein